ncbi:hypothetical protein V8C86DRAFT_2631887 [Haematococcus lacustris]
MAGGADPAALLPFTLCCLRGGLLEVWLLVHWGLLALSLRCLAAPDLLLRAMAYEALGLFSALLESPAAPASVNVQPDGLHPSHVKHDFRERAQLAALLTYARNSVQRPLQRLPHCLALWLAEASCALARGPVSPGFALVSKALLLKEDLDLQQLPRTLLRGLASGTPSAAAEQTWSVALLVAGLQDAADTPLYRRSYQVELAMALAASPCALELHRLPLLATAAPALLPAGASSVAAASTQAAPAMTATSGLCLALVCRACSIPSFASHLVAHAGVIPWLASAARRFIAGALPCAVPQSTGLASQNEQLRTVRVAVAGPSPDPTAASLEGTALTAEDAVNIAVIELGQDVTHALMALETLEVLVGRRTCLPRHRRVARPGALGGSTFEDDATGRGSGGHQRTQDLLQRSWLNPVGHTYVQAALGISAELAMRLGVHRSSHHAACLRAAVSRFTAAVCHAVVPGLAVSSGGGRAYEKSEWAGPTWWVQLQAAHEQLRAL